LRTESDVFFRFFVPVRAFAPLLVGTASTYCAIAGSGGSGGSWAAAGATAAAAAEDARSVQIRRIGIIPP